MSGRKQEPESRDSNQPRCTGVPGTGVPTHASPPRGWRSRFLNLGKCEPAQPRASASLQIISPASCTIAPGQSPSSWSICPWSICPWSKFLSDRIAACAKPGAQLRHRLLIALILKDKTQLLIHSTARFPGHNDGSNAISPRCSVGDDPGLPCGTSARFIPRPPPPTPLLSTVYSAQRSAGCRK